MRLPQPPPAVDGGAYTLASALASRDPAGHAEVAEFLDAAQARYFNWDEVRRRKPQGMAGLTSRDLWSLVKLRRSAGLVASPVTDARGERFVYAVPMSLQPALHEVDRRSGAELLATDATTPDEDLRDRFLVGTLMEEAISTSRIEGAVSTIHDGKAMLRTGRTPRNRSEHMIVNGYRTMQLVRDARGTSLDIDLLHQIQASITRKTLDDPDLHEGRFRGDDDDVRIENDYGEVVFRPPPAAMLDGQVGRLVAFANERNDTPGVAFVHPLVRACIVHFWLAYLHPYADGNGRTARALFYWSMLRQGYVLFEYLTLSRVIHDRPTDYYRAFINTEQDGNDLTYFLVYLVDATRRAVAQLHDRVAELRQEQRATLMLRGTQGLNARQRAILAHALRHPLQEYTVPGHAHTNKITQPTARADLAGLVEASLFRDLGGRPRVFVPAPDLRERLGA